MSASPRSLASLAGVLWAALGVFLALRGAASLRDAHELRLVGPSTLAALAAVGVALGVAKGSTVLRKTARKNVARLRRDGAAAPNGRLPLYAAFTPAMWGVIAGMSILGMILRRSGLTPLARGPVLLAVGLGLLLGALHYFAGAASIGSAAGDQPADPAPDPSDA